MRPALRNHALRPQPDVALALFLVVPPEDMGCGVRGAAAFRAHSSAGFGVWCGNAALRKRLRLGSPGAWGPKNQGVFGVPRVCAMKNPARFPRRALLFKRALLYFPRIFNQGCIPPDLNIALLLRKCVSLLRSKILPP